MKKTDKDETCSIDIMPLENQLCFGLYATSHAMIRAYRPLLVKLDLTYPQFLVMLALWEKDGQVVSALGASLYLDSGTLSPLLKRLEASELITKTRMRHDERLVVVHLTQKGWNLRPAGEDTCNRVRSLIGMSAYEINALRRKLDQLLLVLQGSEAAGLDAPKAKALAM